MFKLIRHSTIVATAGLCALALAAPAHADIISALAAAPTPLIGGGYAYTYNVTLTDQQQLDPSGTAAAAEFGTIYDFGPIVGTITETGLLQQFTFVTAGTTTSGFQQAPNDNPSLTNIKYTYAGSTGYIVSDDSITAVNSGYAVLPDQVGNLGTFTVDSPYGQLTSPPIEYDGEAFKATNDTETGNVGFTSGPSVPVPEPASMMLLAAGLAGLGMARRRRRG